LQLNDFKFTEGYGGKQQMKVETLSDYVRTGRTLIRPTCRGVTRGGQGGHNFPDAESLWGRRITAVGAK